MPRPQVLFDIRWEHKESGIGRLSREVRKYLTHYTPLDYPMFPSHPLDPFELSRRLRPYRMVPYFSPGYNVPLTFNGPTILTICDLNHIDIPDNSSALKRFYYQHLLRPSSRKAFKILTISNYAKQRILSWTDLAEQQVIDISLGVGNHFLPDGPCHDIGRPYFIYVGARKPHKNLPAMIESFGLFLKNTASDAAFLLVGDKDPVLDRLIARQGLTDRIIFSGSVPDDQLPSYYRGATALIFTSRYEGFGLPVAEALACGTPVITSPMTALPETGGTVAFYAQPDDIQETARLMAMISATPQIGERMRIDGPKHTKQFTWPKTAERVQTVFDQALDYCENRHHQSGF